MYRPKLLHTSSRVATSDGTETVERERGVDQGAREKIAFLLLTMVKRRTLQWCDHVSRSSGLAQTILQGTVKRVKTTRPTEEEVGRQHQGMDRPGVRQVPEGSGEQGKMEKTGCEIMCGALTTPTVKR